MDWISEDSMEALEEAMDLATEYSDKMRAFRSGLGRALALRRLAPNRGPGFARERGAVRAARAKAIR